MVTSFSDGIEAARASVTRWPAQLEAGWREAGRVRWPASWRKVSTVLVCGMGGSALGADLVRQALATQLRRPLEVLNGYDLPGWVGRQTLMVCSSYSGNTAETLSCARAALARGVPLAVLAGGGRLASLARQRRVPCHVYQAAPLNPSRQPRLGLALQVGSLLRLLRASGTLVVSEAEVEASAAVLRRSLKVAGSLRRALAGQAVAVIGVGPLAGAAHVVANELNENAKLFAAPFALPEADHHLLEGLTPKVLGRKVQPAVLLLEPHQVARSIRGQLAATRAVLRRQGVRTVRWQAPTTGPAGALGEALRTAQWGAWLSVDLAAAARLDPLPIPWVDLLKRRARG